MKKHFNLFTQFFVCCGTALFCCTSCGGGGGGDGGSAVTENADGLAPEFLTKDMVLTPVDFDAGGRVLLTATPARVAYFNSERNGVGNYVDGTNSSFTEGRYTYTGNYTYTKCGPNMADLKVDNLRAEPADTADDCHWTIVAKLTFIDENTVVFTGTETLVNGGAHDYGWHWVDRNNNGIVDDGERWYGTWDGDRYDDYDDDDDGSGHNDPMGFGGGNHFPGVEHAGGGTRNFSLNYKVSHQAH